MSLCFYIDNILSSLLSFNVLLDHCFATPLPYNVLSGAQHSFFTGYKAIRSCGISQVLPASVDFAGCELYLNSRQALVLLSLGQRASCYPRCQLDKKTVMEKNGMGLSARFFFEVFRFLLHQDRDKSSIYLHCVVRLCEPSKCQVLFYKDTVESLLPLPMCSVPDRVGGRGMRFNVLVDGELPQSTQISCSGVLQKEKKVPGFI